MLSGNVQKVGQTEQGARSGNKTSQKQIILREFFKLHNKFRTFCLCGNLSIILCFVLIFPLFLPSFLAKPEDLAMVCLDERAGETETTPTTHKEAPSRREKV